ncbi:hypothetical protein E2C01_019667 [Portunus trituberculatus]|uniref:Uncharacterized protein n=1 Tax=Portunus trituberculatus TaxID=210409 RepID=A0A5B7E128_PORTR|nr:hypothetical protein [Portunus trituberculatus]
MEEELGAMVDATRATAGPVRRMSAQSHSAYPVGSGLAPGWRGETDEESEDDKTENPPRTVSPPCPQPPHPRLPPCLTKESLLSPCRLPASSFLPASGSPLCAPRQPKPQEFDGRVSLEAYLAQFEVVAQVQGWSQEERALNLVTSLKGPAVEVLSLNTRTTGVLHGCSGRLGEALLTPVPGRGVSGEVLGPSPRTWRNASEETAALLLCDQLIDALEDAQSQQALVANLQEALAQALEFESFIKTSAGRSRTDSERNQRY